MFENHFKKSHFYFPAVYLLIGKFSCLFTFVILMSAVCLHFLYQYQLFVYYDIRINSCNLSHFWHENSNMNSNRKRKTSNHSTETFSAIFKQYAPFRTSVAEFIQSWGNPSDASSDIWKVKGTQSSSFIRSFVRRHRFFPKHQTHQRHT